MTLTEYYYLLFLRIVYILQNMYIIIITLHSIVYTLHSVIDKEMDWEKMRYRVAVVMAVGSSGTFEQRF